MLVFLFGCFLFSCGSKQVPNKYQTDIGQSFCGSPSRNSNFITSDSGDAKLYVAEGNLRVRAAARWDAAQRFVRMKEFGPLIGILPTPLKSNMTLENPHFQ